VFKHVDASGVVLDGTLPVLLLYSIIPRKLGIISREEKNFVHVQQHLDAWDGLITAKLFPTGGWNGQGLCSCPIERLAVLAKQPPVLHRTCLRIFVWFPGDLQLTPSVCMFVDWSIAVLLLSGPVDTVCFLTTGSGHHHSLW